MKRLILVCCVIAFAACVGCGGSSPMGIPNMNGTWSVVLTGAAASQGATPPPGTTLTVTLNQNGKTLSGVVAGVNIAQSSCLFGIADSQTRFTVNGNVTNPIEAGSNLRLTLNFVAGSANQSLLAVASASGTTANGLFSISPGGGCKSGNFAMTKVSG